MLYFFILFFLTCNTSFAYTDETLKLNSVMTSEDMKKTGVASLTQAQKQDLAAWITRWTKMVLDQSNSYHPAKTVPEWVAEWPSYAKPVPDRQASQAHEQEEMMKEKKAANKIIDKVRNDGEIIELKDGSIWIISPFDRYKTRRWQRNDAIQIEMTENVFRPYRLRNTTRLQVADAELQTEASHTGEKPPENPEYYSNTIGVSSVRQKGEFLELQDSTCWKIAPADQIRVRKWQKNDRVRVTQGEDYLYPYILNNVDSGETVLANSAPS